MTVTLCLVSFAAGVAVHWAATRIQVGKRKADVLDLVEAQQAAEGDLSTAIRLGEGA